MAAADDEVAAAAAAAAAARAGAAPTALLASLLTDGEANSSPPPPPPPPPPPYEYVDYEEGDYVYDFNQSLNSLPVGELSAVAVFYGLAFVLGCVGNALVVYCVSKHRRMRTTTNYFLLSLACADLLLIVVCIPVKVSVLFSYEWLAGELTCKLVHCTQAASTACSILTLTTISLERYYAISKPIHAKYLCTRKHAQVVILGIWIASVAVVIPKWFGQAHAEIVGKYRTATWCTREWSDERLEIAYETSAYCLFFLLPVAIMTAAYFGVYRQLRLVPAEPLRDDTAAAASAAASQQQQPPPPQLRPRMERSKSLVSSTSKAGLVRLVSEYSSDSMSMRKSHLYDVTIRCQVVKMLIAVVVVFIVCWGPLLTLSLLTVRPFGVFEEHFPNKYPHVRPLKEAFYLMAYFNSCLNPIIYGFMSKYFRKSFSQALACCSIRSRAGSLSRSTLIRTSVRISPQTTSDKFATAVDAAEDALAPPLTPSGGRESSAASTPVTDAFPIFGYDAAPA